ncbi:MAG: RICIN domain-containing protein [Xanthobacteraceae bacterium]
MWSRWDGSEATPGSNGSILQNVGNRLCLDLPGGSLANGAKPIAWVCHGGTNQTWRYVSPTTP